MKLVPLKRSEMAVGKRLPWDIYGKDHALLLKKGSLIESERALERLTKDSALYRQPIQEEYIVLKRVFNPFYDIAYLALRLQKTVQEILNNPSYDCISNIENIARTLIGLVEKSPDACIGAVHRYSEPDYAISHSIHVAILSIILGRSLKYSEENIFVLACVPSLNP